MASKKKNRKAEKAPRPELNELAAAGGDDVGAEFVGEIRAASDEVLRARSRGDVGLYDKVLQDHQVYSTFQQRRLAVVARDWAVEPGGDAPGDKLAAEDIEEQITRNQFDSVTYKMLAGILYGRAIGECLYRPNGSRVELGGIKVRKARRFTFDRDGQLRLIKRNNPQGIVMPERKFWVFRALSNDDDDPHGLGLGHYLYWLTWFKRNALRFWPLFLERFAAGTPIAKVPPGTTPEDRSKVLRMLDDIRTGGRLVIPSNVLLEILQAQRNSGGDYQLFCEYLDAAIAKVVLSQTMTTDSGSSRSQAEVHQDVKLEVIKSDADLLCESFNDGPVTWLTQWNHPGAAIPRVWRKVVAEEDLNKRATRDKTITELGFEATQEYIDQTYGEGFIKKQPVQPGQNGNQGDTFGNGLTLSSKKSNGVDFAEAGAVVSAAVEEEWRELIGPEVTAIDELVASAGSLEQVRDRLGELAQRHPDALVESLARMKFAARVAGQVGEEVE